VKDTEEQNAWKSTKLHHHRLTIGNSLGWRHLHFFQTIVTRNFQCWVLQRSRDQECRSCL